MKYIFGLFLFAVSTMAAQTTISPTEVKQAGLHTVDITTVNGEEPQWKIVYSPWQSDSYNITYGNKVPCRIVISIGNDTLYDSGPYEKNVTGATIRINGNTTALYSNPLNMPYKLKLEKASDILCRGDDERYGDKHWRLLKDATSLNTIVALKLSQLIGMEWTSAYIPCNVIINGDYRGCYLLMETVKRNNRCRIGCNKQDGSIVERDPYWWKEDRHFSSSWYCDETNSMYRWTWKYPDEEDLDEAKEQYIQQCINEMEQSMDDGTYNKYIDIISWTKWILAHDILGTRDSGGANMYIKKYDGTQSSLLEMPCLWDFDSSYEVTPGSFSRLHTSSHTYFATLFNSSNRNFASEYVGLWNNVKQYLPTQLTEFVNTYAQSSEAAALNASRILYNKRWGTTYGTVENDVLLTLQWLESHIGPLDQNISSINIGNAQGDTFTIDSGEKALYDSLTNTMLVTIPKSAFGTDYKMTVNGREQVFSHVEGGKTYNVDDTQITFTFLPMLHIDGTFGNEYKEGTVSLYMPDGTTKEKMTGKLKWRGGTTNAANKHKRNYKLNLDSDQQFFGMRSDDKWILDAGQNDLFRLRNRIATELWNDMACKPYYAEQEANALSGVRGQVLEVFLNDEYQGIYCLTECMDRKEMKLKKYKEETGEVRGCLYKSIGYGCSLMWNLPSSYDNMSETWDTFEIKYPDLNDAEQTDWSTLWNAINFVAYSNDEDFSEQVASYFDLPVVIDYYIFLNILNAFDNVGKNMYWAVYDKTHDKRLTLAVWDLDGTVGAKWITGWTSPTYEMNVNLNLIERLKAMDVDGFDQNVKQRYHQLRSGMLSTESLTDRYSAYYDDMRFSGAAGREEIRWSLDSDISYAKLDIADECNYITDWIVHHMEYLDNHQFHMVNTHVADMIADSNPNCLYTINGQRIGETMPSRKGVYIKNGKKYIVK